MAKSGATGATDAYTFNYSVEKAIKPMTLTARNNNIEAGSDAEFVIKAEEFTGTDGFKVYLDETELAADKYAIALNGTEPVLTIDSSNFEGMQSNTPIKLKVTHDGYNDATNEISIKPAVYNVTLDLNYTDSTAEQTKYTFGEGLMLPAPTATREHYTFAGWYDNAQCTGDAVTVISDTETGDKTYYAKWTQNDVKVTLDVYEEFENVLTVEQLTEAGGNTTITATAKENAALPTTLVMYQAIYTGGVLKSVSEVPCTTADGKADFTFTAPQLEEGEIYKLMLWTDGQKPVIDAICSFAKLYVSSFEHSETIEEFEEWYNTDPNTYTQMPAKNSFTGDLDLIILQMTDNVNTDKKISNFNHTIDLLIKRIKLSSPNARIIFVHGWFNKYNTYDKLIEICNRWQIERVDISDLKTKENEAVSDQSYKNADGEYQVVRDTWITHPGDRGMKKIADRIIATIAL